jgi:hypothetical protein
MVLLYVIIYYIDGHYYILHSASSRERFDHERDGVNKKIQGPLEQYS